MLIPLQLLLILAQSDHPQLAELRQLWEQRVDSLHDLSFTLCDADTTTRAVLVGQPHWAYWRYDKRHGRDRQLYRSISRSWDGMHDRSLQSDGMGSVDVAPKRNAYMASFAGVFLSNWGFAPCDEKGRRDSWLQFLENDAESRIEKSSTPGCIILRTGHVAVTLDAAIEYYPVRLTWFGSQGNPISDVYLEDYRQIGEYWVPTRIRDEVTKHAEIVEDVQVNRGLTAASVRLDFPAGTSVLYPGDVVRVVGADSTLELEESLRIWLQPDASDLRSAANVQASGAVVSLTRSPVTRTIVIAASLAIAALVLAAGACWEARVRGGSR